MLDLDAASDEEKQYGRYIRLPSGLLATPERKILVPLDKRNEILERFHNHIWLVIWAQPKLFKIRRRLHWKSINKDVAQYVENCLHCAKRKQNGKATSPLNPIPVATEVWQRLAVDIMGPISPMSKQGHKYVLVVTDYATRMLFTHFAIRPR